MSSGGLVLLVEDDKDIRWTLRDLLETSGFRVACAGNGKEALEALDEGLAPSVIVLDLMMPVMNGYQFRAEQKRRPEVADVPVVVLTAAADIREQELAPVAVFHKPMDIEQLIATLEEYCLSKP